MNELFQRISIIKDKENLREFSKIKSCLRDTAAKLNTWFGSTIKKGYKRHWVKRQIWNSDGRLERSIASMLNLLKLITAPGLCKRTALFLGNTHRSIWGKGLWCVQLSLKWVWVIKKMGQNVNSGRIWVKGPWLCITPQLLCKFISEFIFT